MLIKQYAAFVDRTDQFSRVHLANPREIATYGLASEIGSIVSAVKKETLQEGGALSSPLAKAELREELGDAMWYAFALARIEDTGDSPDILLANIVYLKSKLGFDSTQNAEIGKGLSPDDINRFLEEAIAFEKNPRRKISDYQKLAFHTARTDGGTLLTVCAAVLTQLGAQLMRHLLPQNELEINTELRDRPIETILGDIAWHLCAIASLYELDMDEVAEANFRKASARGDGRPTPLHDQNSPAQEQLPRNFYIDFQSVSNDTSQMFWNGNMLGDPLKDQHYEADGYRFHDVLHLANAACLGWSPVLRDLMKIKRDSCPRTKQAQDSGRSAVVEELVIKFIHWEASRRAKELRGDIPADERPLFPKDEEIPFSLLKKVRELTVGHEVYDNKFWEWERAIREGYRVFQQLRHYKQGRVFVDLKKRNLRFEPLALET